MTPLSVVVAAATGLGDPSTCAAALLAELDPGDEILWVGAPSPSAAITLEVPGAGGRGDLYRAGLDRARHPLVAFTDTATVVQPGWRTAVGDALAAGVAAVGGPVLPGPRVTLRSFAGFVAEYGPHAAPPYSSATHDVAANNVAYERVALDSALGEGEPVWKAVVDARLAATGRPPLVLDQMRVVSARRYGWADLVVGRAAHGRLYGAQQASIWSRRRRAAGALACLVLPGVAYARLSVRLVAAPELRYRFALASPLVLLGLIAWSVGEAIGLFTATGAPRDIL